MRLFLVRHGETDWNLKHLLQGITDIPLNDTGKKQALVVKSKLENIYFDVCFSSPLKRAYETAQIITNKNINCDDRLMERRLGLLEGKSDNVYDVEMYWDYNLNSSLSEVESVQKLLKRAKEFLDELKLSYASKTVLVVSHYATIRALHYIITGYNENTDFLEKEIPNCCILEYNL